MSKARENGCYRGDTILQLREAARIPQGELSEVGGILQTVLCSMEKGKRSMTPDTFQHLVQAIDDICVDREADYRTALAEFVETSVVVVPKRE